MYKIVNDCLKSKPYSGMLEAREKKIKKKKKTHVIQDVFENFGWNEQA